MKDCLDGNAEFDTLGKKYGIDNNTDSSALEKKIIAYVTLHYLEVHKWLGDLNNDWKAGKYYQTGFDGAGYGHKIIGMSEGIPNPTDKEIIQQTLNGLFEQNKLADPTTIVPCIDDDTAHKIVVFGGEVLEKAAKGSITDLVQLISLIKGFGDQIPQSVSDCLDGNAEFDALGKKYGIDNNTDSSVIEKKVIAYVTLHYLEVHKWFGDLNNNWKAGKYYQVGFDGAGYGHKVLGLSIPNLSDKEILQQGLDGVMDQNKLPHSTTIIACGDDDTNHRIVVFITDSLQKAAKGSVADLISLITELKKFLSSIPQPVIDCLSTNTDLKALGLKYGIDDTTDSAAIEKKVVAYVTLHYLTVHKWFGDLNTSWQAGKYQETGFNAADYAHKILGLTPEMIKQLIAA